MNNNSLTILDKINSLSWPSDRKELGRLSILELQIWISGQDPRQVIYWSQTPEYVRFIKYNYLWPLKLKRFAYRFKKALGL